MKFPLLVKRVLWACRNWKVGRRDRPVRLLLEKDQRIYTGCKVVWEMRSWGLALCRYIRRWTPRRVLEWTHLISFMTSGRAPEILLSQRSSDRSCLHSTKLWLILALEHRMYKLQTHNYLGPIPFPSSLKSCSHSYESDCLIVDIVHYVELTEVYVGVFTYICRNLESNICVVYGSHQLG